MPSRRSNAVTIAAAIITTINGALRQARKKHAQYACHPGEMLTFIKRSGQRDGKEKHRQAGLVEHIIVTQGRALVGLTSAPEELNAGDYICYPAGEPHLFKALESDTMAILVAEQN